MTMVLAVSCSSNDKQEGPNGPNTGEKAYAVVNLQYPESNGTPNITRGTVTTPESKIHDVTLYVFDNQKILEKIVDFDATDLTNSYATFETTVGQHYFLVAINKPSSLTPTTNPAMPSITIGETLANVEKKIVNVSNAAALAEITKITNPTDGKFFMTNYEAAVAHTVPSGTTSAAPSAITLKVGRAMAKVRTNLSPTVSQPKGTLKATAAGDVEYMVAANPVKMHTFPVFTGSQLEGVFFGETDVTFNAANYFPTILPADDYTTVSTQMVNVGLPLVAGANADELYAVENSHATPLYGNSTYLIITGIYAPVKWFDKDGVEILPVPTHGDTFYRIGKKHDVTGKVESYLDRIFKNNLTGSDLTDALNDLGIAPADHAKYVVVEYDGGRVYYGLWLANNAVSGDPAKKYTVGRNNLFRVSIDEINGPGSNTPDLIPNPIDPIEEEGWIRATISVENWVVIDQGGIVG